MSEYTPTPEEIKSAALSYSAIASEAAWDRWLAAHDAEMRAKAMAEAAALARSYDTGYDTTAITIAEAIADAASVVSEEPDWEYGVSYSTPTGPSIDGYRMRSYMKVESVEKAQEFAALVERPMIQKRTKAVPAGEWVPVPVKQEGETDA